MASRLSALVLLLGLALGQTLYLPLDDRPPNWAPCAWGLVLCPPRAAYRGPEGADEALLRAWLLATPGERLVASLDALAYGGLLQSRHRALSPEEALARLEPLLSWRGRHGGEVFLFGVVPRWDASRRERNLEVLRRLAPWALLEGLYLEAVWDDALKDSPAPREARELPYPSRPGADEAGQVLLLRALRPGLRVGVVYRGVGAERVTPYEALPLRETVAGLLRSAGAQEVALAEGPDLVLYAYGGQDPRGAARELLGLMARFPVALADLARVNRGDPGLMAYLQDLGLYGRLAAYASWGTPANNLGSALAQGGLFLSQSQGRLERLAEAYFAYWWGEVGRPHVRARFAEPLPEGAQEVVALWPYWALEGYRVDLEGLGFPWRRAFEAQGRLRLHPLSAPSRLVE
ncbi:MAG: DUF4127 family protein [Thermus sp.]|uniref:DUF4127 family protein n=1 Tax=Thermus sp. TaxID=275 RepID=UPI00298F026F|nr:DUF4127 family protein [Thermus sp.]MDW8018175.1 DUF4127 family protein [Thermus sp.]